MDLDKLIGKPALSYEEKVVHDFESKEFTSIGLSLPFRNTDKNYKTGMFENIKPLVEQLIFEINSKGYKVNPYGARFIELTMRDVMNYITEREGKKPDGILMLGSIARFESATFNPDPEVVSYVVSLNFCEINNAGKDEFDVRDIQTLTAIEVPLTANGILHHVGATTTVPRLISELIIRAK